MNSSHSIGDSSAGTSTSLVQRVRGNDANAWQRLVDLYGPLIYTWAGRGGLSPEDAADVMQEVFTSVAKSIKRFDPAAEGRFRGWLWTITRNKIHDHFRRASPPGAHGLNATGGDTALRMLNQLPEHWDDDSSAATRNDVLALYHRAMQLIRNDFETQTWQAFWMSVVEERPTDEIARSLGMSSNSVRQAKSRVLRRLKQELSDA